MIVVRGIKKGVKQSKGQNDKKSFIINLFSKKNSLLVQNINLFRCAFLRICNHDTICWHLLFWIKNGSEHSWVSHSCSKYINIKSKLEKNNTTLTPSLAPSDMTLWKFMVVMLALKIKQYIRDCRVHEILEGKQQSFHNTFWKFR